MQQLRYMPVVSFKDQYEKLVNETINRKNAQEAARHSGSEDPLKIWTRDEILVDFQSYEDFEAGKKKERGYTAENVRDGKFGAHLGYGPAFRNPPDMSASREKNIEYLGSGQLGDILLDMEWNTMEQRAGWAEMVKPAWDKKLWDDSNTWFNAPTIRDLADINNQIGGAIVTAVASVIATPVVGALLGSGATWLGQLQNDLFFATLDTTMTDKDNSAVWADFGKRTAINTVTSSISMGAGAAGGAVANSALSAGAKIVLQTGISVSASYTSSVATSYINALDFRTGEMDWETANKSWFSSSTIANALGSGVTAGLNAYLPTTSMGTNQYLGGATSFIAGMGGELTKYATYTAYNMAQGQGWDSFGKAYDDMGGLTLNVLNTGLFTGGLINVGLVELHVGRDGTSMNIGTGGVDVSKMVYDFASWGVTAVA